MPGLPKPIADISNRVRRRRCAPRLAVDSALALFRGLAIKTVHALACAVRFRSVLSQLVLRVILHLAVVT